MDDLNQPLDMGLAQNPTDGSGLRVSQDLKSSWWETARWTQFISIFYMIMLGLLVFGLLIFGSFMVAMMSGQSTAGIGAAGGAFVVLFLLAFLGLFGWITWCLYRFSSDTKKALQLTDQDALERAFRAMKTFWKILGVMLLMTLAFYVLLLVMTIGAASSRGF